MDFEILYRLYFRDVYRYVRGLSRDEHLAEEIAQETFARALGAVDRFDGRGDVRAWLFTIARNVWVDHCRRHRRETELPGEDLPGGGDFAGALEDREEVLALHRILHTLPEPYKEVFGPAGVRGAALPGHRAGLRKDGGLGPCDLLPGQKPDLETMGGGAR